VNHLLAPHHRPVLDHLARSDALLAFDYDGTLAPIVSDPTRAHLRPRTRALLEALTTLYRCAVVTGRARADVSRFLRGLPFAHVIGNHGAEWEHAGVDVDDVLRTVASWRVELLRRLGGVAGVTVEDKGLSLAIHYRRAIDPRRALAAIRAATSGLGGRPRVFGGKQVVNVTSAAAIDKGDAVSILCSSFGYTSALYVGDDLTDEDVFARADLAVVVTVRIASTERSHARYKLRDQREIDELLTRLLASRAGASSNPPGSS
jgi:trehalose 6-phosphate phosphatase